MKTLGVVFAALVGGCFAYYVFRVAAYLFVILSLSTGSVARRRFVQKVLPGIVKKIAEDRGDFPASDLELVDHKLGIADRYAIGCVLVGAVLGAAIVFFFVHW